MLDGCTTLPNGRDWGQDATFRPGWQRVREVAIDAARSPRVWAPLAGAALLQIDGWDRHVSDWARDKTPVFGSQQQASDWSDRLLLATEVSYLATVLATPSGDSSGDWIRAKSKGFGVELAAMAATSISTDVFKAAVGRERPNGENNESFPSGHASHSAVVTQLAERNLRSVELPEGTRLALDIGLDALTAGTAWARVEAGAHFPSDTLFSIGLGNYMGMLFNDAFLGLEHPSRISVSLTPLPGRGAELQWEVHF